MLHEHGCREIAGFTEMHGIFGSRIAGGQRLSSQDIDIRFVIMVTVSAAPGCDCIVQPAWTDDSSPTPDTAGKQSTLQ